jgi:error-prone DNA polymerase
VVFLTLEDETGFVNLIVWASVYERYRRTIKTSALLGVSGKLQVQHGCLHLVVSKVWQPHVAGLPAKVASRDFH